MKKQLKYIVSSVILASLSMNAQATFTVANTTIQRTLSEGKYYGGCMISLSKPLGHGCPSSWVSLDCQGGYTGAGERNFSTALMAFSLNKTVAVYVDPVKKYNGYCVATRIDVLQ